MKEIRTFPAETPITDINNALREDGACIIQDLISVAEADRIVEEMSPYIEGASTGRDTFTGYQTKRVGALIARSQACREITMHEKILDAANAFLGPQCDRIQLHLGQIIDILPGQGAQALHRDRFAWGIHLPQEVEPQFNTIWALTEFTSENGATHIIPGSQNTPLDQPGSPEDTVQAVMSKGSVLIYSGTVIHGGGENRSDGPRMGLNITYCLGWLRTEENMMLSCPPEIARNFPKPLTDLLGYTMGNYALGYYSTPALREGKSDIIPPENALGIDREEWPDITVSLPE